MTSTVGGIIILFLLYASGAIFVTVMLAVGITWSLKEISRAPELEAWLKQVLNASEKSDP